MPSSSNAAGPLRDLIDESLDEAVFLWQRWESELSSLTRNLDEVWSWTEDRLHGALDGVRVAGEAAVDILAPALLSENPAQASVAAAVLGGRTDAAAIDALTSAMLTVEGDALRPIVRGLELSGSNQALRAAASALAGGGPAHAAGLCRLKAFRRAAIGAELKAAISGEAPRAHADALASAFYPASGQFDEAILAGLASSDDEVRGAAVTAGISRGMTAARDAALRLAREPGPIGGPFLKFVAIFGAVKDHDLVFAALRVPAQQKDAIRALGHVGTARAAEACIAGMKHEPLARACAEAYCWITGADLTRDRLAKIEAQTEAPEFEEDDLDANLVPAADDLWPAPDADAVRAHWESRRDSFTPDVRFAHGVPASLDRLMTLVETGPMLRRPDLILELRARSRGSYDVEPRAFAARQRQMMTRAREAAAQRGGQ
jgi:uncharacterized protein (TIGR02270 family)